MRPVSPSLRSLSVQVLLWTALPFTILLMVFAFSGVSSHQQSMRSLAVTENARLVNALARLIASERENHAWRHGVPVETVQAADLDLAALLTVDSVADAGSLAMIDHEGDVLFGHGDILADDTILSWPGVAEVLAGERGVLFTSDTMHGDVVTYAPVADTSWSLILRESWHALTAPLLRIERVMPFILFTATAISLLALFFGLRYVVQPLRELGLRADQIGQGRFDVAARPVGGVREIEDLRLTLHHMAAQVQSYQAALQDYLRAVTQAQEEERARISRELHDETVQTLIALGHKAQMAQRSLERDTPQTGQHIADLRQMIAQAVEEVRRFSRALHPHYLDELGLVTALETLAREAGAQFCVAGSPQPIKPEVELALYRIAQEALNNARRHAQAASITVELRSDATHVVLRVDDDGRGFEVPAYLNDLTRTGHFGLIGMRERAQLVNGQLEIMSAPGEGTTITLLLEQ
jgi:two-component system, NarL family, sensor histidine kinase UhpB